MLALVLIGCESAPPHAEWTPPRAQVLSQGQNSNGYSETDRASLAVGQAPRPKPKPSATAQPLPAATAADLPQMPDDDQVPNAHLHQPEPSPAEVSVSTVPRATPESTSSEENLVDASIEVGIDSLTGAGTQILFVLVDIAPHGPQLAAGCDLALLVDVSGSVLTSGTGMSEAVLASSDICNQQGSANRTWVIAFGSQAQLVVDGLKSVPNATQIGGLLRQSSPAGGGSLLSPAISLALDSLCKAPAATRTRHVVIVSDGELSDADIAKRVAASAWKNDGISFSAILVGGSSDGEGILRALSSECNGQFARAAGMASAGKLLRIEADLARSIVLRDLRLQANLASGVTLRRAFLAGTVSELATAGTTRETLKLGDLHRQQNRKILLELEVKPGVGKKRVLAWISLLSRGADAKERPPQVLQQVRVLNGTKKATVNPVVDKCVDAVYAVINRRRR